MTQSEPTDASLFDSIAELLPAEQRPHFYRRMAHLRRLEPTDDVLQMAEAMGFLALITRETPAAIAAERIKFEALLRDVFAAIAQNLGSENRAGGDAAAIHAAQPIELNTASSEFVVAVERLSHPETGIAKRIARSLSLMEAEIANASSHVRVLVGNLHAEIRGAIAVVAIGALFVGFLLGLLYARWTHAS